MLVGTLSSDLLEQVDGRSTLGDYYVVLGCPLLLRPGKYRLLSHCTVISMTETNAQVHVCFH